MELNPPSNGSTPSSHKTRAQLIVEIEELYQRVAVLEAAEAEQRDALKALRESEEKHRIILDDSSDPIFMFYPDGTYRYVNKAFADGVGKSIKEIEGKKIWDVFPKEEADKRYSVVKWVFENGLTKVIEVRVPRPDGDRFYITTVKPILGERDEVLSVICISKEITDRKNMEEELRHLSTHDALTGLYNRYFFETELERIQNSRLFPVSIVVADLDNLKRANDRRGHAYGDELIQKIAGALHESFRVEDIIARLGGDEFVVLLPETDESAVQAAVTRLHANIAKQGDPMLTLSVGWASGEHGSSLDEILRQADDRMYEEKSAHKRSTASLKNFSPSQEG